MIVYTFPHVIMSTCKRKTQLGHLQSHTLGTCQVSYIYTAFYKNQSGKTGGILKWRLREAHTRLDSLLSTFHSFHTPRNDDELSITAEVITTLYCLSDRRRPGLAPVSGPGQEVDISLSKWDHLRQQHIHLRLVVQLRLSVHWAVLCKVRRSFTIPNWATNDKADPFL